MSSLEAINELIQQEIPLCVFMQMKVTALSDTAIKAVAPLAPNRNMHQTGFAGSLYALAVATGWAMGHHRQELAGIKGLLVVKEATMHYKRPVTGDIELQCELSDEAAAVNIAEDVAESGRASLPLVVWVMSKGKKCGYLEADYVIVPEKE